MTKLKSLRLNAGIRDAIIGDLIQHSFQERYEALKVRISEVAEACYVRRFNTPEEYKLAQSLPEGFLDTSSSISVQCGDYFSWSYDGDFRGYYSNDDFRFLKDEASKFRKDDTRRTLHKWSGTLSIDVRSALGKQISVLGQDIETFKEDLRGAVRSAKVALGRTTTTGRLKELWPEVAPFVEKYESPEADLADVSKPKPQLPAIQVEDLNRTFKLPVDKAA